MKMRVDQPGNGEQAGRIDGLFDERLALEPDVRPDSDDVAVLDEDVRAFMLGPLRIACQHMRVFDDRAPRGQIRSDSHRPTARGSQRTISGNSVIRMTRPRMPMKNGSTPCITSVS